MLANRYWYGIDQWLNPMGMGCWQIGGNHQINGKPNGWGHISTSEATYLIHQAIDNGIELFDTAASYGNSEILLGKAINTSSSGKQPVICTKIALEDSEISSARLSEAFITRVEKSLERLQADRIDILLLHNPPDDLPWGTFETTVLNRLRDDGKIGTYGVSCRSMNGVKKIIDTGFGTCVEWVFNILERRPLDVFPLLKDKQVNFIARSPLSRGLFSPKYRQGKPLFKADEFRSGLNQDWINWVLKSIDNLNLNDEDRQALPQIALQYCLSFPEMSAVIPGINKPEYLESYLKIKQQSFISREFIDILHSKTEASYPPWN